MINVFIGYDSKEKVAFNTLSYSILKNSTKPVAITPIYLNNIKDDFVEKEIVCLVQSFLLAGLLYLTL